MLFGMKSTKRARLRLQKMVAMAFCFLFFVVVISDDATQVIATCSLGWCKTPGSHHQSQSDEEMRLHLCDAVSTWLNELAEEYNMRILKLLNRYDKCSNKGGDYVNKLQVYNIIVFFWNKYCVFVLCN